MSRAKDILLVGLSVCSGALAIVAWRQHGELQRRAARDAVHESEGTSSNTITVRTAANRMLTRTPAASAGLTTLPGSADQGAGMPESPATPSKPTRRGTGALVKLMENPEFVSALTLQRHSMLDARFGELFRRMNLEGDELAQFKRLLAEKENVALEVVTVSETAQEGALAPETLRAGIHAAQSQIEQAIHSSLGSDRYAIYRDYERTLPHRATVAQLEQRLSYTRTPLTAAQAEAVVRILAANTPPVAENVAPPASVLVRPRVPEAVPIGPTPVASGRLTEEVVTQVQTVLEPPQVAALRELQVEQQAAQKAADMIRDVAPSVAEIMPTWPLLLLH